MPPARGAGTLGQQGWFIGLGRGKVKRPEDYRTYSVNCHAQARPVRHHHPSHPTFSQTPVNVVAATVLPAPTLSFLWPLHAHTTPKVFTLPEIISQLLGQTALVACSALVSHSHPAQLPPSTPPPAPRGLDSPCLLSTTSSRRQHSSANHQRSPSSPTLWPYVEPLLASAGLDL